MKTIAIYHKDCIDGTTAAAVVLKKYPEAMLFPLSHKHEPSEMEVVLEKVATGDNVFTVDCVIGVKELLEKGHKVISIDHHEGAKQESETLAKENTNYTFIYDKNKSGASLSWSYFFPKKAMPEVIKYVEDNDLWIHKYGKRTLAITEYLSLFMNKPDEVIKFFEAKLKPLEEIGNWLQTYADNQITHSTETTNPIYISIGKYKVPFFNITEHKSASGNILSKKMAQAVALFTIDGRVVKISLRSLDRQIPSALDIAKIIGGGGHRNASGASMPFETFLQSIIKA